MKSHMSKDFVEEMEGVAEVFQFSFNHVCFKITFCKDEWSYSF
jgi:hypothetical protein